MLWGFKTYTMFPTRGALLAAQKGETFASISREEGFTSCGGIMLVKYKPWPAMEKPVRPMLLALQDVCSRKILAWRMGLNESTELVRFCAAFFYQTINPTIKAHPQPGVTK